MEHTMLKKRDSKEYIKRYGLKSLGIKEVELKNIYVQYRPEALFRGLFLVSEGKYDFKITNSPHFELAKLYYVNGSKWLEENYRETKYYKFKNDVLKQGASIPVKKIKLFNSIRKGYLNGKFKDRYIVILNEPLVETRYGIYSVAKLPEIFMGHHRAAALLALGVEHALIIGAEDIDRNKRCCYGKLHDVYKNIV